MGDERTALRSPFRTLDLATLIQRPVDALLGVTQQAKAELERQHIKSIFDLAASSLFAEAAMLVAAADDPDTGWAVAGKAPASVVDSAIATLPVEVLAERNIRDLRALSESVAARLSAAFDVTTIRELASWPPYVAARALYQQLLGHGAPPDTSDPGTPPDLLPTSGRHPTDRAYYQNILLERFIDPPAPPVRPMHVARLARLQPDPADKISIEAVGQLDITSSLLGSPGFQKVAIGALVQFSQSWYTAGLTLGQLLHSLALAPGESTRIAMIDWSRRERGTLTESTTETDRLDSQLMHNRALGEVVNAVANEVQTGASASQASGESWGVGKSGGGGGSYGGQGQSYGFGGGYSIGYGSGKGQASSWGVSTGSRNLRSELSQNIQDLTHQASTMIRNRWATTVQEVSQEEHERLSTRAVTNYNHMHALTIQYYEVVQVYRVAIDIDRITRCIFIPLEVLDFSRRELVSRFREVLAGAALIPQVRTTFRSSEESTILTLPASGATWDLRSFAEIYGADAGSPGARDVILPAEDWAGFVVGSNDEGHPFRSLWVELADGRWESVAWSIGDRKAPDAGAPFGIHDFAVMPNKFGSHPLRQIRRVGLRRGADQGAFAGTVNVILRGMSNVHDRPVWINIQVQVASGQQDVPLFEVARGIDYNAVVEHLADNALHYSQAVWRAMDAASVSLALAGYAFSGRQLLEVIDPTPVGVAANYLIFRLYAEDEAWVKFLDSKDLRVGPVSSTAVPLPSGGVFAEAVLGRANGAEKLDITRFWNWQDSPIPIAAPDIAALQAGSRNQQMQLETGKLSPSVLNIMNPTPLPDPSGMSAALSALAQGAMFRDMSGLAGTIGLAGTSLQEATRGASDAQKYAAENFKTAASLIAKSGGRPGSATEDGAKTVQGQNMDAREKNSPGSVGPAEKRAFESTLSAPPLVEATPEGSADDWNAWPGTTNQSAKGGSEPTPTPPATTRIPRTESAFTSIRVAAKSYIGRVGDEIGSTPCGYIAQSRLEAFALFTDFSFSEDPRHDAKVTTRSPASKGYRLYSSSNIVVIHDTERIRSVSVLDLDTDSGREPSPVAGETFFFEAPPVEIVEAPSVQPNDPANPTSWTVSWRVKGRPPATLEPGFSAICPRTSIYIWHRVVCKIRMDPDRKLPIVWRSDIIGSQFPSHRLFVDGRLETTLPQGELGFLWNADAADATLVR